MKQTIEIEVPDGKKAVWNNGKIEFIDVDVIELLKDSKNAEKELLKIIQNYLEENEDPEIKNLYDDYKYVYNKCVYDRDTCHLIQVAKLKLFLAYLNKGYKFYLIYEKVYYPFVKFYLNSKLPENEKAIGHFSYKGNTYALVSGQAYYDANAGLTNFDLYNGLGSSYSYCGFLACKDCKTAQFVATTFGKLLFDVNFGSLIKYEWLD